MIELKKLLKLIGIDDNTIAALMDDKLPDEVTAETISNQLHDELGKIYASKNKPNDDILKGTRIAALKDFKKQIGRAIGLSNSNSEIEEMKPDDFVAIVGTFYTEELNKAKNGTNETYTKELEKLKAKVRDQDDAIDLMRHTHKAEIETANKQAENKIKGFQKISQVDAILGKMQFAFGEDIMELPKNNLRKIVSEMNYKDVNGRLYEEDGTTPYTVEGKRINSLDEFVNSQMLPYIKKNNGQGGQQNIIIAGNDPDKAELAQKAINDFMTRNPNGAQ